MDGAGLGMNPAPSIRRLAAPEWRAYRALRLRALADSPDAFGSTLALESAQPDADWSKRLASGALSPFELPLVGEVGAEAAGLAWARIDPALRGRAHLYQMWVDPSFRRLGIARRLLDAAIDWAERADARSLFLSVTCGMTPAARLYAGAGFVPAGDPEPLRPGSPLLVQPMQLVLRGADSPAPDQR